MNTPTIVFDFGGVLLDWNPRHLYRKLFPGDEAAMEHFLLEIGFAEWNHLQDASHLPFSESIAGLCARHPQYSDLIRAYDERFLETLGGAIPGTVEILDRLRQTGFSLFGLSNWSTEKFHLVRPNYTFFNWFQGMVISGEVKLIKPDPRIFQVLLAQIGRPAGECLFIDDSLPNITVARELGFQTIHFHHPAQLESELTSRGLLPG
jgi:2-haloacid dehalogenase